MGSSRLGKKPLWNLLFGAPLSLIFIFSNATTDSRTVSRSRWKGGGGAHNSSVRWTVGGCRLCWAADEWKKSQRASALHTAWKGRFPSFTHRGGLLASSKCEGRKAEMLFLPVNQVHFTGCYGPWWVFSCHKPWESRCSAELWSQQKLLSTTWWQTPFTGLWKDYGVMLVSVRWDFVFKELVSCERTKQFKWTANFRGSHNEVKYNWKQLTLKYQILILF